MTEKKMLQILVDGQAAIKTELKSLRVEMNEGFNKVQERIDKIGSQLAYLEDDTPTREEFDDLDERVTKIEKVI